MSNLRPEERWLEYMRRGDYSRAWQNSDAILSSRGAQPCWDLPRHQQSIWNGTPLAGKRVLVRCYHGLGDSIMFVRYAPLIKRLAKEVVYWMQPALIPLLRSARGIDQLNPLHQGSPDYA